MDTYRVDGTDGGKVRVTFSRIGSGGSCDLVTIEVEPATAREVGAAMVAVANHVDRED